VAGVHPIFCLALEWFRSTQKIVVIHESKLDYWFLPRGRKDLGESLETAALREAYEEASEGLTLIAM